jgi:geranylgeranyl diphosphate synthase type II
VSREQVASDVERLRALVEAGLAGVLDRSEPQSLYAPIRYVLEAGGKRIRPIALLLAAEACGASADQALPAALAVEVFHNFTLVHDDIMDHADTRRGRATVHTRWDEPTAILAGDLMMGESFRLLGEVEGASSGELYASFSRMVQLLCEGQALDKAFESQAHVTVDAYRDMIYKKTGALLECALELGGLIAGADGAAVGALRKTGYHAGQAFQIQDDLLDLTAQSASWGKTIGGDLMEAKKTFLLLCALENAKTDDDATFFGAIAAGTPLSADQVDEARARMDALGVLDEARQTVDRETDAALAHLRLLPPAPPRDVLGDAIRQLAGRAT